MRSWLSGNHLGRDQQVGHQIQVQHLFKLLHIGFDHGRFPDYTADGVDQNFKCPKCVQCMLPPPATSDSSPVSTRNSASRSLDELFSVNFART